MTAEGSATESDSEVEPLAKGVAMILSIVERSIHWCIILFCQGNVQETSETESDSDFEVLADKVFVHVDNEIKIANNIASDWTPVLDFD